MKAAKKLQLTRTQRFVLDQFLHSYPDNMSFEAILNGYENPSNDEIVATEFWSNNTWPCDLVSKMREMEVDLSRAFFPTIKGDSDLMQIVWERVHHFLSLPTTTTDIEPKKRNWLSICDKGSTLTSMNRPLFHSTSNKFMAWFRDERFNELESDECVDIFLTALKDSSDITVDLLERLFSEYDVLNLKVVDETFNFDAISGVDYFNGKCYPYRFVDLDGYSYKIGVEGLQHAIQVYLSEDESNRFSPNKCDCSASVLDSCYVYYTSMTELLTWTDKQFINYLFN